MSVKGGSDIGWTDEQDDILKGYYPIGGWKLCVEKGINKKPSTIRMRAKKLGIRSKNTVWSDAELKVLYEMSKNSSINAMATKLKGRSPKSVKNKLDELGLECMPNWTDEELSILKKYFPLGGSKLVKIKGVNKPTSVISGKAGTLGIKLNVPRVSWTDEEVEILKEYYPKEGLNVADRLNGKTKGSIINKLNTINSYYTTKYNNWGIKDKQMLIANRFKSVDDLCVLLPLKDREDIEDLVSYYKWRYKDEQSVVYNRWSDAEVNYLIENYSKCSIDELQEVLNKSKSSIYGKISNLKLRDKKNLQNWSNKDIKLLKANYQDKTIAELKVLFPNKTVNAIRCKAGALGLYKERNTEWSAEEVSILKDNYASVGADGVLAKMMEQLGYVKRSKSSVYMKAMRLGLIK